MLKRFFSSCRLSLSLLQFNAIIALWLATLVNVRFYETLYGLSSLRGVSGGLFLLAAVVLVFAYYFLVLQLLSWRISAKAVAIVLVVLSAFSSYFVYELGVDINKGQFINVMQTDFHEMLDLISWQAVEWALLLLVLPCVLIVGFRLKAQTFKQVAWPKLVASAVALVVILGIAFVYYGQFAPIFREHRNLKDKLTPNNVISSMMSYAKGSVRLKPKPLVLYGTDAKLDTLPADSNTSTSTATTATATTTSTKAPAKLMVLVVGETGRAESFSLNGYAKNTNPELAKLDILNFSKAASCGTETAVSVPCMFSGMPRKDYDASLAEHREGLLDIAKRAGYTVTWIDNNSGCKQTCDRVNLYTIPEPIKQKWCKDNNCMDDILLDSLDAYIAQLATDPQPKNQLIVLHQMGSHGPAYYKRYPDQFKQFKPTCDTNAIQNCSNTSLINSYDNTILYTDYILAGVVKRLKQLNQQQQDQQQQTGFQTAMWYVSDHGESTGEHGMYLHGAPYLFAPSQQTHVPMILWFSQNWQKQAPTVVSCLKQQLTAPRGQDNLFPTMLSLLDIKTKVIDADFDMLAQCSKQ